MYKMAAVYACFFMLGSWIGTVVMAVDSNIGELRDYCQSERLEGACAGDEVIVMESAQYGRMELQQDGCAKKDYGYIGCGADVIDVAHAYCSGRHTCKLPVPNKHLDAMETCPDDFKSYLRAGYSCQKVLQGDRGLCSVANYVELTSQEGTIANVVTHETGCGSHSAPWVIKAPPGQVISLALADFSVLSLADPDTDQPMTGDDANEPRCIAYAILREKAAQKSMTVCGGRKVSSHGQGHLQGHVYTSVTPTLEVIILGNPDAEPTKHFLLHYKVTGCTDPPSPSGGWSYRQGDRVNFGCNNTDTRWQLSCRNNTWQGTVYNCSNGGGKTNGDTFNWGTIPVSFGWTVGIIVLIAVAMAACILLIGLIVLTRMRRRKQAENAHQAQVQFGEEIVNNEDNYKKTALYGYTQRTNTPYWTHHPHQPHHNRENEYEYIHEQFHPQPPEGAIGDMSSPSHLQPIGMVHPIQRHVLAPPYGYNEGVPDIAQPMGATSLPRTKPSGGLKPSAGKKPSGVFHQELENPPPEGATDPRAYFTLEKGSSAKGASRGAANVEFKR